MQPFFKSIQINNLLSFGPDSLPIELGPLNVIIGTNGSGKSNLFDVLALLKNAPGEFDKPIRESGCPLKEWFWKGENVSSSANIDTVVSSLHHYILLSNNSENLYIDDEWIGGEKDSPSSDSPFFHYGKYDGKYYAMHHQFETEEESKARVKKIHEEMAEKGIVNYGYTSSQGISAFVPDSEKEKHTNFSALSRFKHNEDKFGTLAYLADFYNNIHIYSTWTYGRKSPLRFPQNAYLSNKWLFEDGSNLFVVLKKIKDNEESYSRYLEFLRQLYEGVDDFEIIQLDNLISIRLLEGGKHFPAARLSDGTLRYLMLLAVLCDPEPPAVVCIEEPEMGLHPDLVHVMAEALQYAAERTQVIVTTHSVRLVDHFTPTPEVIQVCEKHEGQTYIERLDPEELKPWLENYRLGDLWSSGGIGGNRW